MNEIETILCKLLKCDRSSLYLERARRALSGTQLNRLEKILEKRTTGEPLQYLLGDTEFMGIELKVSRDCLIPRPETEILVEVAIEYLAAYKFNLGGSDLCKVLDIGTGSGNIPIALAKSSVAEQLDITSVDISEKCLAIARSNAKLNRVFGKIVFRESDIFSCFQEKDVFDCIISNPPYIAEKEYAELPLDVKCEPMAALVASDNGLYFYKRIEEGARKHLVSGGMIFLEIGASQASEIKNIFSKSSVWESVKIVKDNCDRERVALIKKLIS